MEKTKRKHKVLKVIGIILLALILIIAVFLCCFAYTNLNFDKNNLKKTYKAGFEEKQTVLSDGITINYAEGPDNGPALMLIHGQTMCWEDYSTVLPGLSETYHVYAVDCPGHGGSSFDKTKYTCTAAGDELIEFAGSVIGEHYCVSGLSSGGILAAYIAANDSGNVSTAVLEDPPFFSVTPEAMSNTFVWKDGFEIINSYKNQSQETEYVPYYYAHSYMWTQFGNLADVLSQKASENPDKPLCVWYIPHGWTHGTYYMDTFDLDFGMAFYDGTWIDNALQEEILQNIKCPVVYLKAETAYGADGVLYAANTDEESDKVVELIDNCTRIKLKSGHDIHYEKPKEFIDSFNMVKDID
ncbi:MAG: alpha/beta hydrolase [Oscillospiraceae bacterium]|nr:alpha/beta hydrolase [Oscillospiraceae bacterium]